MQGSDWKTGIKVATIWSKESGQWQQNPQKIIEFYKWLNKIYVQYF